MKGKGLSMESIVAAAMELVEEKGYNSFSVRELAQKLHVKAASLYNHLNSIDDVNKEIGLKAVNQMNEYLEESAAGKEKDEALRALAYAFRSYAKNNYQMYRAIMAMPALNRDGSLEIGRESVKSIRRVVAEYGISREDAIKFSRSFRSALHGYASYETAGYFTATNVTGDESFEFLVNGYAEWLKRLEEEEKKKEER